MSLPLNPLDWPGPPFLLFMVALGGLLAVALVHFRRQSEGTESPRMLFTDPYLIGYLRSGHAEAVRLALASLIDRGFLAVSDTGRIERKGGDGDQLRRPLEKAVLAACRDSDTPMGILEHAATKAATDAYQKQLEQLGLLPDKAVTAARGNRYLLALGIFWGMGLTKIVVAIGRGHANVGFLVLMLLVAPFLLARIAFPKQSSKGITLLRDLRTIFGHLKDRRKSLSSGGATTELAMLAAVFGLQMVPTEVFPWMQHLRPPVAHGGSGWGADGSSSCSSGSSSCGSSCGSGCGGGCGGCGS